MKTIVILFAISVTSAFGQSVNLSVDAENMVTGSQFGATVFREAANGMILGASYLSSLPSRTFDQDVEIARNYFYGLAVGFPLKKSESMSLLLSMRAGIHNDQFFALMPGLETRVKLKSYGGIAVGTGLRHGHPSLQLKLFVKLF